MGEISMHEVKCIEISMYEKFQCMSEVHVALDSIEFQCVKFQSSLFQNTILRSKGQTYNLYTWMEG